MQLPNHLNSFSINFKRKRGRWQRREMPLKSLTSTDLRMEIGWCTLYLSSSYFLHNRESCLNGWAARKPNPTGANANLNSGKTPKRVYHDILKNGFCHPPRGIKTQCKEKGQNTAQSSCPSGPHPAFPCHTKPVHMQDGRWDPPLMFHQIRVSGSNPMLEDNNSVVELIFRNPCRLEHAPSIQNIRRISEILSQSTFVSPLN